METTNTWQQRFYYICANCGRPSDCMAVVGRDYQPTLSDIRKRPFLDFCWNERLACPCGHQHTWFTLTETSAIDGGPTPNSTN